MVLVQCSSPYTRHFGIQKSQFTLCGPRRRRMKIDDSNFRGLVCSHCHSIFIIRNFSRKPGRVTKMLNCCARRQKRRREKNKRWFLKLHIVGTNAAENLIDEIALTLSGRDRTPVYDTLKACISELKRSYAKSLGKKWCSFARSVHFWHPHSLKIKTAIF